MKRDLAGDCESVYEKSSVVRVEEVADGVEDGERCRLLWQRAGLLAVILITARRIANGVKRISVAEMLT